MVVEAAHDILDGRRDHTVGSPALLRRPGDRLAAGGPGFLGGLAIGIGFVLLIVPGLFLLTIWALLAPVIVIERKGAMESFGRSRALVRGSRLAGLRGARGAAAPELVLSARGRGDPHRDRRLRGGLRGGGPLTNVLIAPLSALAAAVLYFELRRLHGETSGRRRAPPAAAGPEVPGPRLRLGPQP